MRRCICTFLLALLLPGVSCAAVAFQHAGTEYAGNSGANLVDTLTYSATVASGANRAMFIGAFVSCATACPSAATATFNGDAATLIHQEVVGSGTVLMGFFWQLVAPDVGTFNVVIDPDNNQRIVSGVMIFTGVDQVTPNGTHDTAEVTANVTVTCTVTVPADGAGVGVGGKNDTTEAIVTATQTERWNEVTTSSAAANRLGAGASTVSTGAQGFQFTSAASRVLLCIAAPVNPAVVVSAPRARSLLWFR